MFVTFKSVLFYPMECLIVFKNLVAQTLFLCLYLLVCLSLLSLCMFKLLLYLSA